MKQRGPTATRPSSSRASSSLSQQQRSMGAERERIFAAASRTDGFTMAAVNPAAPQTAAPTSCMDATMITPLESYVINWIDRRPSTAHSPGPGRGSCVFKMWDPVTLALEYFTMYNSDVDTVGRRHLEGGWLYIASEHDMFWSTIVNFHRTGRCLPAPQCYAYGADGGSMIVQEMQMALEPVMAANRPGNFALATRLRCVELLLGGHSGITLMDMADLMKRLGPKDGEEKTILPPWWVKLDDILTGELQHFIDGGAAPCLWVCTPNGCVNVATTCPLEHERTKRRPSMFTVSPRAVLIRQVLGRGEQQGARSAFGDTAGPQLTSSLISNQRSCAACAKVGAAESLRRCARCGNVFYCNPDCQRVHWPTHKGSCRVPLLHTTPLHSLEEMSGGGLPPASAWAVVLPGDSNVKPYAMLLPTESGAQHRAVVALFGGTSPREATIQRPRRGEMQDIFDLLVWTKAAPDPQRDPVNHRACAIVTEPDYERGNPIETEGPGVKCRGDAVVVRIPVFFDKPADSRSIGQTWTLRLESHLPARDFGLKDFEARWGLFQMIVVGDMTLTTLMPLNAESEQVMGRINDELRARMTSAAHRRR